MQVRNRNAHVRRYRQIATVLASHGLGYLVSLLGLERFVPFPERLLSGVDGHHPHRHTPAEHLRMALEELGTTFIKLGQILSTRIDLLPPEYQVELAKLQDRGPSASPEAIRQLIENELGKPVEELFARFDLVPVASASIGQAHTATLHNGAQVVIKVRRPGVVQQVENDLEILQNLASAAARRWQLADQYDLVGLAQEFAQTLRAELDYIQEGRSAERFALNFAGDRAIHIPCVYWEYTTTRVLTLERIEGIKVNDLAGLDAAGIDRKALADRAAKAELKMVFEHGFYHADPHPGNFFVEPGGRIGLVDFGMVGLVDERTQEQLVSLMLGITAQDADRLVDTFMEMGIVMRRVDRAILRQDVQHLLSRYYGQPLGEIDIGKLLNDCLTIVRHHHLQLPSNLALLTKTVLMSEALGVQLDPSFKMPQVLAPYARDMMLRQYSPFLWTRRLGKASVDVARLGVELPQQIRRILGEIERGGLDVGVRPEGFESIVRRLERLANRIVLGIITAAFINGLAALLAVYKPPGWEQWAGIFFSLGFIGAVVLGIYLAWSIFRSGHG